jgi:hypothetical protein
VIGWDRGRNAPLVEDDMSFAVRCVSCGKDIVGEPKHCAMFDRCIPAQNELINAALGEKVYELIAEGKNPYAEQGRPLCHQCFMTGGGVCLHCDLDRSLEAHE